MDDSGLSNERGGCKGQSLPLPETRCPVGHYVLPIYLPSISNTHLLTSLLPPLIGASR